MCSTHVDGWHARKIISLETGVMIEKMSANIPNS